MFLIFIFCLLLNFLFLINFDKIVKIINIYDHPDNIRKQHKSKIPPIGGLIIILNLLIFFLFHFFNNSLFLSEYFINNRGIYSFFIPLLAFFILGLYDDKYGISSSLKLILFSIIIFFAINLDQNLIISKVSLSFFRDIELRELSSFFTVICFVLFINALNMFDGINLQVGSYVTFIIIILLVNNVFTNVNILVLISLFLYLYLNYKNKIYLGDNGAYLLGYYISYIFIKTYNNENIFLADEVFLIMLIPGIDLLRLAIERSVKGKHPFSADRQHIHHLILDNSNLTSAYLYLQLLIIIPYLLSYFIPVIYCLILGILAYLLIFSYFRSTNKIIY